MKTSNLVSICFVGAALILGSAGCAHQGTALTPIPGANKPPPPPPPPPVERIPTPPPNLDSGTAIAPSANDVTKSDTGLSFGTNENRWTKVFANHNEDFTTLKPDTIYFDFDSATIKKSEDKKLEEVAKFLTSHLDDALRVEGNCDERGTEKYNLSLGERRALAAREYLANLGVDPHQIDTVTYGKSKPAVPGHTEAAWSKNRRDDFVVLTPKAPE